MYKNTVSVEICLLKPAVGLLHAIALRAPQNAAAHRLVKGKHQEGKYSLLGREIQSYLN